MTLNYNLPLIPLDFLGYADAATVPASAPSSVPVVYALAADEADEADEDEEDDDEEDDDELEDDDEVDDDDDDDDEEEEEELEA